MSDEKLILDSIEIMIDYLEVLAICGNLMTVTVPVKFVGKFAF